MPDPERTIAGIRCREVLERLSDYLDDDLAEAERRQVEAHLRACDWCERFGGQMSRLVAALRRTLQDAPGPTEDLRRRLRQRLHEDAN